MLLYVPIGHKVGVSDPIGQKAPLGQTCYVLIVAPLVQFLVVPVKLLHRNASFALDAVTKYSKRQKYPGSHWPLGADRPVLLQ